MVIEKKYEGHIYLNIFKIVNSDFELTGKKLAKRTYMSVCMMYVCMYDISRTLIIKVYHQY